jgi:hypothetical protein
MFATSLALAAGLLGTAAASTVGVDLSQATSLSSLQCVHDYGYDFVIARVYCSTGKPDSNGPSNINNAWNAGMAHVDGYIFPCFSCGNPAKQMDDTIDYLSSHAMYVAGTKEHLAASNNGTALGATIGMLWLDIEGTQVCLTHVCVPAHHKLVYTYLFLFPPLLICFAVLVQFRFQQRELCPSHGRRGQSSRGKPRSLLQFQSVGSHHGWNHPVLESPSVVRTLGLQLQLMYF